MLILIKSNQLVNLIQFILVSKIIGVTRINIMSEVPILAKIFGLTLLFLEEFGLTLLKFVT